MPDRKPFSFRSPLYHAPKAGNTARSNDAGVDNSPSTEQQGWEAYRKWLSRVSARPVRNRSPVDHSLYSWRGYNNWADKIKESWKTEDNES